MDRRNAVYVANNEIIILGGSTTAYGIYMYGNSRWDMTHNTIYVQDQYVLWFVSIQYFSRLSDECKQEYLGTHTPVQVILCIFLLLLMVL